MRDEEKVAQQMLRAKEIQMQDIASAYKSCAEENERMSRKLNELKNGETTQYENFRKCENELIGIRFERDQYANKQRELLEEIGTLEQHVEHLNKELERAFANYSSLQHQTMKYSENQKNLKNVTTIMEASQDDYRKKMANQSQELVDPFNNRPTHERNLHVSIMRTICLKFTCTKHKRRHLEWRI